MFAEVSHRKPFSLNVYSGDEHEVGFEHASTLLLPGMANNSYAHNEIRRIPGLKNAKGKWDTRGHRKRIVRVDSDVLRHFAKVIEERKRALPGAHPLPISVFSGHALDLRSFFLRGTQLRQGSKTLPDETTLA